MRLTPLDIKKQQFKKVLRGYDPEEVDTFLDMMANEFEAVLREQKEVRERANELETQIKDYRQIERALQQTLMQAQEATGRTYESARREADLIVQEAELKAAKIVEQAKGELGRLQNELLQIQGRKDSLIGRMRVLLSSELDLLRTLELGDTPVSGIPSASSEKEAAMFENLLRQLDNDTDTKTD